MKTPVAITLIITGGFLVLAPIISDYLQRAQVAAALGKPGVASVSLEPTLSGDYRLGCWVAGSGMVAAAVLFSRRSSGGQEKT